MKEIINNCKNGVKSVIKRFTGRYDEDLEQEVWLRIWKNRDKFEKTNKSEQWTKTVTANICKDYLKSKSFKNSSNTVSSDELPSENSDMQNVVEIDFEKKCRQQLVTKAVFELKPKLREVVIMYEIRGMSYEQIAKKLNCPQGTVKSRLFKAREELFKKLENVI